MFAMKYRGEKNEQRQWRYRAMQYHTIFFVQYDTISNTGKDAGHLWYYMNRTWEECYNSDLYYIQTVPTILTLTGCTILYWLYCTVLLRNIYGDTLCFWREISGWVLWPECNPFNAKWSFSIVDRFFTRLINPLTARKSWSICVQSTLLLPQ